MFFIILHSPMYICILLYLKTELKVRRKLLFFEKSEQHRERKKKKEIVTQTYTQKIT